MKTYKSHVISEAKLIGQDRFRVVVLSWNFSMGS